MSPPRVIGRARWKFFPHPGTDLATFTATDRGYHLSGRAALRFPDGPAHIEYAVSCDRAWRPKATHIHLRQGRRRRFLKIDIAEDGAWTVDGFPRRDLTGFTDVDLNMSPSTNTLAIKRLNLPVGGSQEIEVGWIVFPDLEVRAVQQRYERLSESRYRFESLHNNFVAEFDVDDRLIVTDYPGFSQRVPLRKTRRTRARRGRA